MIANPGSAAAQSPASVRFALADGEMAGLAFGPSGSDPRLVFLHATGFNARAYAPLLAPLAESHPILAVDLRGHGRSTLPARLGGYDSWSRHRDDVIALIEHRLGAPVTLAGHSMGATTALLVAGARPDLVRGLCLIDPVLFPKPFYRAMHLPGMTLYMRLRSHMSRQAARRRSRFRDRAEAAAALTGRGIFKAMAPEVLDAYLADGLIEDGEGMRLACPPKFEAATYAAQRHRPWAALARAPTPFVLLRAEHGSTTPQPAAARIAALRPDVRVATIDGATHALPWERPDRARAAIESVLVMAEAARPRDLS